MDAPSLLIGLLAGMTLMTAIFRGTECFERRKTSVSRTPLSIQTLVVGDSDVGVRS